MGRPGRAWPRGWIVWSTLALVVSSDPSASAQEERPLGEVTVRAERLPEEELIEDPTTFATVVDVSEKTAEVDTVSDVLSESVGVQVRRFGGLGAFSTLSIRGSAAGQVQVYLDGIPMSRARNEVVNLSTLPLDAVERIEIYRSGVPVAFSRAGPGGVVNIVTKSPGPEPRTLLSASYGSFRSRKVDLERSARRGPWEYLVFGTYSGTEGDFTFIDDNGTPSDVNPFDDVETERVNNAFNSTDVLTKVGYAPAESVSLQLVNQTFYKDEGVPGLGSIQARDTSLEQLRTVTHLRGNVFGIGDGALDALDLRATGHVVYGRDRFSDPEGEIGVGNQETDDATLAVGGDALFTYFAHFLGADQVPGLLASGSYERFDPEDRLDPASEGPDQARVRATIAAQNEIYLASERIVLVPAVRWEWIQDDFEGSPPASLPSIATPRKRTESFTSPRIGLKLRPLDGLDLLGNIGRSFRPPNFGELYGDRGVITGNSELDAEEGTNRDVGFRFHIGDRWFLRELRLEYAYFDNDFEDLIVLIPRSQGVLSPENVGAASVQGHEVSFAVDTGRHVRISGNYTRQDAIDRGEEPESKGKQLPGRPRDEAYLRAELYNRWGSLAYDVNLIGENFRARGERDRIGSRQIHGITLKVTPTWLVWARGLTLTFEVKNLTNDQTQDFAGFPLPGRSFFGTVQQRFGASGAPR